LLVAKSIEELKEALRPHWDRRESIGFVPTMGALHEGHLSLFRRARKENDYAVVSIFVNPIQFGPKEDYERYPRDFESDRKKAEKEGIDLIFYPTTEELYPTGYDTYVTVEKLSKPLCGAVRPGHFRGVATVVLKLFNLIKPTRAYFGLKDYQQYLIVKRMVDDLHLDIEIVGCPTVREPDGLAMSSRNQYLSKEERKAATVLYRALQEAQRLFKEGEREAERLREAMTKVLESEPLVKKIDYVEVVHPETLEKVNRVKEGTILAIALWIGKARLIDHWELRS
jgi:pantoate--beta-alanine ligase